MLKISKFEERQKKRIKTKQEIEQLFYLSVNRTMSNFVIKTIKDPEDKCKQ